MSTGRGLLVYGSGGHGKVVADAASSAGWRVIGFADDDPARAGTAVLGIPIVAIGLAHVIEQCRQQDACAVVALGDNRARSRVFAELCAAGVELGTIIHARAWVAPSAVIGAGSVVFAGAVVNPAARIGHNAIVNTCASLDHDNLLGDHAHVAPGVHTGGTVTIGAGTMLGVGASVRHGIRIGEWSIIGVGSTVVADLPDRVMACGNPARAVRSLP